MLDMTSLKRFAVLVLSALMLTGFASAEPVTGVVTNKTTGKPASGDDVVLLKLAQGMQELTRTKTDGRGHFTIDVPAGDGPGALHMLRVTHDKANYFKPIQPGTQSVAIDVYSAQAQVDGVVLSEDVMQVQTEPGGNQLRIVEHFLLKNQSSPAMTQFSEHPFELYLPAGATIDGAVAKAPGGVPLQSSLVPMGDPNHYTIIFPIRPGDTEFHIWYKLPYKDSLLIQPRPTMTESNLAVMLPKSMEFKAAGGAPYTLVTEDVGKSAQAYVAQNVQPSQPLGFTVSGTGSLPRDTAAPATGTTGTTSADPQGVSGGANGPGNTAATDTRPGIGIREPVDPEATHDPWSKYKWWIIAALALVFAAGAGVMLRSPETVGALAAAGAPGALAAGHTGSAGLLQILKDELFAVETERLEGKLSQAQYSEIRSALEVVMRRALARSGAPTETLQVVPE